MKVMNPVWTRRCWLCVILSPCYSVGLSLLLGARLRNQWFFTNTTMPDRWGSCFSSEISWTIWLLYSDRLCLLYNKYIWLLPWLYGSFRTCKIVNCGFQITYTIKQCTVWHHTNYYNTTNYSEHVTRLELLLSRNILIHHPARAGFDLKSVFKYMLTG